MSKLRIIDLAKRTGNDSVVGIVNSIAKENGFLYNLPFRGIDGTSFKYGRRTGYPTVEFRGINQGVSASKGIIVDEVVETKMIGGRSEVDKNLAENDPRGINALRKEEDEGFLASLGNLYNETAIYGNSKTNKKVFDGLATLMNTTTNKPTVLKAGATSGSVTSIYAVAFNDVNGKEKRRGVEGLLGKNKLPTAIDMDLQYALDKDNKKFLAYTTEFEWEPGFVVYDDLSIGRIANINSSNKITVPLLNELITSMLPFRPSLFLINKTSINQVQGLKTSSVQYMVSDISLGQRVYGFDGIPFIYDENILDTESVIS